MLILLTALGACCVGAAFVLVKALRLRTAIYRYDVRCDQRYRFPAILHLSLHPSDWKTAASSFHRGDTPAVSHCSNCGSARRRWATGFEPYIEIESARGTLAAAG